MASHSRIERSNLREGIKNDNRMIRARHDGLGNRDQLVLLAEDAKARRLWFATIELRGGARRGLHTPGLDLRQRHIELRAVAHAALDDRQHIHTRKIRQKVFEPDQIVREFPRAGRFRQFFQPDRLLDREFPYGCARKPCEVCATTELLAHLERQRANVSARRTFDYVSRKAAFYLHELVFE